jgi:hypothetical protein
MSKRYELRVHQRRMIDMNTNRHEKQLEIVFQEMQIKTKMRYHFTSTRMTIIKKINSNKW